MASNEYELNLTIMTSRSKITASSDMRIKNRAQSINTITFVLCAIFTSVLRTYFFYEIPRILLQTNLNNLKSI